MTSAPISRMAASAVVLTVHVVALLVRPPEVLSLTVDGFSASSTQRRAVGSPNSAPMVSEPMKLFSVASEARRSSLMSCLIVPAAPRSDAEVPEWVNNGTGLASRDGSLLIPRRWRPLRRGHVRRAARHPVAWRDVSPPLYTQVGQPVKRSRGPSG